VKENDYISTLHKPALPHVFGLFWWLVILVFAFCVYVAWHLGFLELLFVRDKSHLTKCIAILTIGASVHAAWYIILRGVQLNKLYESDHRPVDENELAVLADRLRAPVETGWFMVDLAIRLGLAGTIIGFILIFGSLSGEKIVGDDALRELLVSMSGGMGTALFTTLAGLIAATFLSLQYLLLGRQTEHVIAAVMHSESSPETG